MSSFSLSHKDIPLRCEVVIVGGGVAGASAAYHLKNAGVRDIVVLETGKCGNGGHDAIIAPPHAVLRAGDDPGGVFVHAQRSGSAVIASANNGSDAGQIKMMLQALPTSAEEFISCNGFEGARRYLSLASKGIALQMGIAKQVLPRPGEQMRALGSIYVGTPADRAELKKEFETLSQLGADAIEFWEEERIAAACGADSGFSCAIFFKNDGVINSAEYARGLLRWCSETSSLDNQVRVYEGCAPVNSVSTFDNHAITCFCDGSRICSSYVVMATGGLFTEASLSGILQPSWSYLISVPIPPQSLSSDNDRHMNHANSPNFFTWGYSHDWCMTGGFFRLSGEDGFSALKPPRASEKISNLVKWTRSKFPHLETGIEKMTSSYGVLSSTPDHVPIVGTPSPSSRVAYVLGCNASGQASLSYGASLMPAILGYKPFTLEQKDLFLLLDIRRFALLPAVNADAQTISRGSKL
jgi:glycine/D-amino acid oxidase-like deaminating enzyme